MPWFGRAGGLRRGRCKYIHVSSVAASMRLTPLRSPPARPLTVSLCVRHGKSKENQSQKRVASLASTHSVDVCRPRSTPTNSGAGRDAPGSVRGGAVWACRTVGAMGPRHASGGLGRTPNPGLAVCAGQRTRARRHRAYMDVLAACPASPPPPTSLDKRKAPRAQRIWKRLRLPTLTHAPAIRATIGVFPLPRPARSCPVLR